MRINKSKLLDGITIDTNTGIVCFYTHGIDYVISCGLTVQTFKTYRAARDYLKSLGV